MNQIDIKKSYIILNKLKKDLTKKCPKFNYPYTCNPDDIIRVDSNNLRTQYALHDVEKIFNFLDLHRWDMNDLILAITSIYIKRGCEWLSISNKNFMEEIKNELTHHLNLTCINKELKELEGIFNARDTIDDFIDDDSCNIFVTNENQENGLLSLVKEGKYSYISFCECMKQGAFTINSKKVKDKVLKFILELNKSINQIKIKS